MPNQPTHARSAATVGWLATGVAMALLVALSGRSTFERPQLALLLAGGLAVVYLTSVYEIVAEDLGSSPVELGSFALAALAGPLGALCAAMSYGAAIVYQERHVPDGLPPARPYRLAWSAATHGLAALVAGEVLTTVSGTNSGLVLLAAFAGTAAGLTTSWLLLSALAWYDGRQRVASWSWLPAVSVALWLAAVVWAWDPAVPLSALAFTAPLTTAAALNRLTVSVDRLFLAERERRRLLEVTITSLDEQRSEMVDRIHAGPLQQLAVASMLTGLLEEDRSEAGRRVRDAVVVAADQLRTALLSFAPVGDAIARAGFSDALTAAVRARAPEYADRLTVDVTYRSDQITERSAHHLLRIALEASVNAFAHNPPGTSVTVRGGIRDDRMMLRIDDDGPGVDADTVAVRQREGHIGVSLMRERASWLDAQFRIERRPGGGTSVIVDAPLAVPRVEETASSDG